MTDFLSPKTFSPSQNAQLFCAQDDDKKVTRFGDPPKRSILRKLHNFLTKKAPKISCDIRNCIKISLILGSTVHTIHFAKLKIVTKNLDFARYGPFGIFGTSVFFVIWGARLIFVCEKLKSETRFGLLSCIQLRLDRYPKIRNQVV